jgi:hypothetical protein
MLTKYQNSHNLIEPHDSVAFNFMFITSTFFLGAILGSEKSLHFGNENMTSATNTSPQFGREFHKVILNKAFRHTMMKIYAGDSA